MPMNATRSSWPQGYGLILLEETDSTMSEAKRRATEIAGPTWIMAKRQTAAHGRRGRAWISPEGNFAGTLVLRPSEGAETVALRSFVAALALFDSFVALTGRAEAFALKWPNDVLLNGGKVAGILLESSGDFLLIGIGVNLQHAPDPDQVEEGAMRPMSLARDLGLDIPAETLLDTLAQEYAALEDQFVTHGFAPIRRAWLAHAAKLGEVITARTMRDSITGTFEDIDEAGNLLLRTSKGVQAISAADVFF